MEQRLSLIERSLERVLAQLEALSEKEESRKGEKDEGAEQEKKQAESADVGSSGASGPQTPSITVKIPIQSDSETPEELQKNQESENDGQEDGANVKGKEKVIATENTENRDDTSKGSDPKTLGSVMNPLFMKSPSSDGPSNKLKEAWERSYGSVPPPPWMYTPKCALEDDDHEEREQALTGGHVGDFGTKPKLTFSLKYDGTKDVRALRDFVQAAELYIAHHTKHEREAMRVVLMALTGTAARWRDARLRRGGQEVLGRDPAAVWPTWQHMLRDLYTSFVPQEDAAIAHQELRSIKIASYDNMFEFTADLTDMMARCGASLRDALFCIDGALPPVPELNTYLRNSEIWRALMRNEDITLPDFDEYLLELERVVPKFVTMGTSEKQAIPKTQLAETTPMRTAWSGSSRKRAAIVALGRQQHRLSPQQLAEARRKRVCFSCGKPLPPRGEEPGPGQCAGINRCAHSDGGQARQAIHALTGDCTEDGVVAAIEMLDEALEADEDLAEAVFAL